MTPDSPLALFLVRAWYEEGSLRARIRHSVGLSDSEANHLVTDPEEVIRHLRAWFHALERSSAATYLPPPQIDAGGL